jgi:hypothetical protein
MIYFNQNAAILKLDFHHFFGSLRRIVWRLIKMSDEDNDNGDVVEHIRKYRTTTFADRYAIFMAIKATMVNGHLKSGIQNNLAKIMNLHCGTLSRQWTSSSFKLAKLLGNQDEESGEPIVTIIQRHAHFLFDDDISTRKKGQYKYDRELHRSDKCFIPRSPEGTQRGRYLHVALVNTLTLDKANL